MTCIWHYLQWLTRHHWCLTFSQYACTIACRVLSDLAHGPNKPTVAIIGEYSASYCAGALISTCFRAKISGSDKNVVDYLCPGLILLYLHLPTFCIYLHSWQMWKQEIAEKAAWRLRKDALGMSSAMEYLCFAHWLYIVCLYTCCTFTALYWCHVLTVLLYQCSLYWTSVLSEDGVVLLIVPNFQQHSVGVWTSLPS